MLHSLGALVTVTMIIKILMKPEAQEMRRIRDSELVDRRRPVELLG